MPDHAAAIIGLYQRHARDWDAQRGMHPWPPMEAGWLDRFVALLPARPDVLDLGCGAGTPMARYLAESGCAVTGVDSSPAMIALCRARLPLHAWYVADMRGLSLDGMFNGILAWDSFFHLNHDDQRRMFAVFRAHAAPGAALMFTSGPAHGEAIGCFESQKLYHASLDAAEYKALLRAHGFEVVAHAVKDPSCGGHTIWLAQCAPGSGRGHRADTQ